MTRELACRTCGSPILIVREADSTRRLVLNAHPVEGGRVVLAPDRRTAQMVPPGPGAQHTVHACERRS